MPALIGELTVPAGPVALQWQPASDAHSGIGGYRVYVGANPEARLSGLPRKPR